MQKPSSIYQLLQSESRLSKPSAPLSASQSRSWTTGLEVRAPNLKLSASLMPFRSQSGVNTNHASLVKKVLCTCLWCRSLNLSMLQHTIRMPYYFCFCCCFRIQLNTSLHNVKPHACLAANQPALHTGITALSNFHSQRDTRASNSFSNTAAAEWLILRRCRRCHWKRCWLISTVSAEYACM